MEVWQFNEQSMHYAWDTIQGPTKVTPPNRHCDPVVAHKLYNRYLDEWLLGDELGFNIFVNEHHASSNCMSTSCTLTLSILARQTRNARLLALGCPIANRTDPYRVAEEFAMIDVISGGRLEMGLVKASPFELAMSNQSPARIMDRYWEAHDFIVKAMTHQDGPFTWQGEFFQYRNVNVWPRPYQQPMPPMWITASGPATGKKIAQLGYVCATFFNGAGTKILFDAYKEEYRKTHGFEAPANRLAYLGMMVTGHNEAQVAERVVKMKKYLDIQPRTPPAWINPPGYEPVEGNVKALKMGKKGRLNFGLPINPTIQEMADGGIFFAGTPDRLYEQIKTFSDRVGGIDHLLVLSQAADLSHEETVDSLTLFAKEVLPRLKELKRPVETPPLQAAAPAGKLTEAVL
ncbi:MAG TPA: LLM class flavin-dependent oxidoreductase [Stellaceae bacterium]|nr:LLM class flavin-dependent oxidoreductase [Stellaceae bacterium]